MAMNWWRRPGPAPGRRQAAARPAIDVVPETGGAGWYPRITSAAAPYGGAIRPVSAYDPAVARLGGEPWGTWRQRQGGAAAPLVPAQSDAFGMAAYNAGGGYPASYVPGGMTGQTLAQAPTTAAGPVSTAAGTPAPTTGEGTVKTKYREAPAGVPAGWYRQFQEEHGGETPEEFYRRTGEGLDEALADRAWGEQFARERGRPPSEDDWRYNWFMTRKGRPPPTFSPEQWDVLSRYQRRRTGEGSEPRAPRPLVIPGPSRWRVSPL